MKLFVFFICFRFIHGFCNNSTYKIDYCNRAVDNADSVFTEIDKNLDGVIDDMEYKENCELGYQEEQFCFLDLCQQHQFHPERLEYIGCTQRSRNPESISNTRLRFLLLGFARSLLKTCNVMCDGRGGE